MNGVHLFCYERERERRSKIWWTIERTAVHKIHINIVCLVWILPHFSKLRLLHGIVVSKNVFGRYIKPKNFWKPCAYALKLFVKKNGPFIFLFPWTILWTAVHACERCHERPFIIFPMDVNWTPFIFLPMNVNWTPFIFFVNVQCSARWRYPTH